MKPRHTDHSDASKDIRSGRIISRYVKKNALFAMLFAVLGLWALQMVFAYLAELEDISDAYTYVDALTYIFYRSPYFLQQFMPTGALLGAVVGLGLLANNSELIVMRAAGLSIYRIVGWVLQPAFIFVILALLINQFILPQSNVKASQIRKPDTALLASVNGYWTLQNVPTEAGSTGSTTDNKEGLASEQAHNIIFIDYADANGNIGEVKRWHLDADNNLTAVSKATGGTYVPSLQQGQDKPVVAAQDQSDSLANYQWQLDNVTTLKVADKAAILESDTLGNQPAAQLTDTQATSVDSDQSGQAMALTSQPLVAKQAESTDVINLPISPSSVYLLTRRAEDLSLTQLYEHKRFNASQGTRSLEHEVAFWQKLLSPFSVLSLVIVACSFVFGSLRTHSLGLRIVVAIIFGLLFSYIQDLTSFVSLATGAPPLLMVLLPIIGSGLLGFYLIRRQG
ncbi:LptF/LptG family permease [Psychrobacter sp. H7-1]|uniref:LptF/LptG family permease n=1 Tax=Psychrobacter sp. H7-1 TaxID=1569265 RepID=UPI001919A971|nr:LptF/LptG family permease [Psychrobacter sp. H7-1]